MINECDWSLFALFDVANNKRGLNINVLYKTKLSIDNVCHSVQYGHPANFERHTRGALYNRPRYVIILLLPPPSRSGSGSTLPTALTLCLLSAAGPQQGEGEVTTSTHLQ